MADIFKWTNDAKTTLDGAHNNTTLTINVANGALFPSPSAGEAFAITIKKTDGTAEICYCTSRTSDALTVTRGQETSLGAAVAQTYVGGETIGLRVTAGSLVELIQNSLLSATGDIMYASAANTPARLVIGATDKVLSVAGGIPAWVNVGPNQLDVSQHGGEYIKLSDVKTATAGGTFTSGAWRTRDLNTEDNDTGNNCSLSSNQFTLNAGTYRIAARAPAHKVDVHKIKLRNITDSTDELIGSAAYCGSTTVVQVDSFLGGQFTIAAQKTFAIQHICQTTKAGNGFGVTVWYSVDDVYAVVELWKVK